MGRVIVFAVVLATLVGCGGRSESTKDIEVPKDELIGHPTITRSIVLSVGDTLELSMGANNSTPFRWPDKPTIGSPAILQQTSHDYQRLGSMPGSNGKDVWTFKALTPGTTTIYAEYTDIAEHRPAVKFTANVTVH